MFDQAFRIGRLIISFSSQKIGIVPVFKTAYRAINGLPFVRQLFHCLGLQDIAQITGARIRFQLVFQRRDLLFHSRNLFDLILDLLPHSNALFY